MPPGKIVKKTKNSSRAKHSRPSRRQTDEDLGKLQTLDRTIQEHQKAQFYGIADAQLDFNASKRRQKGPSQERSLKALENLTKVERKPERQPTTRGTRDLRALDNVLETLSKMDFAPSKKELRESQVNSSVDEPEIDV